MNILYSLLETLEYNWPFSQSHSIYVCCGLLYIAVLLYFFSRTIVLVMSTVRFLLLFMHQPYTMTATIAKRRNSPSGSPTVKYRLSVNAEKTTGSGQILSLYFIMIAKDIVWTLFTPKTWKLYIFYILGSKTWYTWCTQ